MLAPAHTAPELVELAQAEALRILHNHQRRVGHVHAHLNDGGGHQHVNVTGGKGGHDRVLVLGLHLSMDKGHPQVGEHLSFQCLGVCGHRLQVGQTAKGVLPVRVLLYGGADNVGLTALGHQLAHKAVHPLPLVLPHHKGLHRRAAGGQLVDDRHVQISVHDEGQGTGDGGGGHDQHMGPQTAVRLGRQGRTLGHAEAVLLVGDDQPQLVKFHALAQQGVGAHHQVHLARRQGRLCLPLFGGLHAAGEQPHLHPGRGQQG